MHRRVHALFPGVRYLELDGVPALSKIGLGTWQFGSREWGYGEAYASRVIRHPNVVAIVGASAVEQVEANAAAAHLQLAADEIDALTVAATAFRPLR